VADRGGNKVAHLSAQGAVLWHGGDFSTPMSVSVNPTDGSCWVADFVNDRVVHLAPDGTQLWAGGSVSRPWSVSVNSADGSCWVADFMDCQIVHLAANGSVLWRGGAYYSYPDCVSANSADGSCWANDYANDQIVHYAADGTELWRGASAGGVSYLSANAGDGSCWVGEGQVIHLAGDGTELWRSTGFGDARGVSANPSDNSCWVADAGAKQAVHLVVHSSPFDDVPAEFWAFDEIMACFNANIVKGYDDGLYHPDWSVTRDQMAVYVARALVTPSGDAAIPDPGPPPSFSDVAPDSWAYNQIEYAVSQNVVEGYEDGAYQPALTVDRGQMAVYIARAMVAPGGDAAIPDAVPPATFPDVPDTFWAYKQVEYCVGQEVVKGYDDGNYHPDYPVTRDQMAVYIARAFGLL
jgi:hypothetical protein